MAMTHNESGNDMAFGSPTAEELHIFERAKRSPSFHQEQDFSPSKPDFSVLSELKNGNRLAEIRSRMYTIHKATLLTSFCARNVRRDFNIASAKMYVFALDRAYKLLIEQAISDLHYELTMLTATVMPYSHFVVEHLTPVSYNMLVVSPESASMIRALTKVDRLMSKLYEAEFRNVITRAQRHQMMLPFMMVYTNFKRVAMKIKSAAIENGLDGFEDCA